MEKEAARTSKFAVTNVNVCAIIFLLCGAHSKEKDGRNDGPYHF